MKLKSQFIVVGFSSLLVACTTNKEADLPKDPAACDTLSMSYATDIAPIIQSNKCLDCHSAQTATAGIILDTYTDVSANAQKVLPAITWGPNLPAGKKMPVGGLQVSSCEVEQFSAWIKQGKQP